MFTIAKEEILKKVEIIEERKAFVGRCLEAKVCPNCGSDLKSSMDDHGFVDYKCAICNFTTFLP